MKKYYGGKEKRNYVPRVNVRKVDWFGHMLSRNFPLKEVIEGTEERSNRKTRKQTYATTG
jgi:hypothetical protein